MVQITSLDIKIFLIHALALKLWLFEVCIGSHSLAMFALRKFTGVQGTLKTLILYGAIWMPACIVGLHYASSSTMWWCLDNIFFCLVYQFA